MEGGRVFWTEVVMLKYNKTCLSLSHTELHQIWQVFGQLIQTSTKFFSRKIVLNKKNLKKN